jgi:hypothetical protein
MNETKEANFDDLMRRFQDCTSAETAWAMNILHVDCTRFHALMRNRMNLHDDGYNNLKDRVCKDTMVDKFIDNEPHFAGLYEMSDNWINFINKMREFVRSPPVPVPVPARAAYVPVPVPAPVHAARAPVYVPPMSEIEIKKANFDELMRRFQDCTSAETAWAMGVLKTPNCADVTTVVNLRMSHVGFNNDFKTTVCTPPKSSIFSNAKELQFVQTVSGLNSANWIAFVDGIRHWVNQPPQQAVAAVAAVAAQTVDPRVMRENWDRIRTKLSICDKTTQQLATALNLDCRALLEVLGFRGDAFQHSLFAEHFDDVSENQFVDEVKSAMRLTLDPAKWTQFIEFLRHSIRSPYQQPVASDADQDASRASEAAMAPSDDRAMPETSMIYGPASSRLQNMQLVDGVLTNIFRGAAVIDDRYALQCNYMIGEVLHKHPSFTQEQLNAIYGTAILPMLIVPDLHRLFQEAYPQLDSRVAFGYACMAYLEGDIGVREQVENYFITTSSELNAFVEQFNNPEQIDVYRMWKRCFMIAHLMHSWTQIEHYDRSGVYADARQSLGSQSLRGGKSKRSKRSNSKRSNSKRSNSKRSNSKRSNSKRSNSKRSNSKRSNSKRGNSKRSNCRSRR